ncbi:hypothetical protein [Cytobacillus oceanisediminis]|uniref:hypothetical protein n=1 Tax=Cytobacillus oceanisediminis TaxID=665099 RepID=UPI001FB30958|nr:hypothetical protein [Cytobacillus oceanisediminis]UOE58183.1 hypothetical protein IRB79_27145 [Cytobacillus oceanisediminis]
MKKYRYIAVLEVEADTKEEADIYAHELYNWNSAIESGQTKLKSEEIETTETLEAVK